MLLAQYELYLEGARRGELRAAVERWDRAYQQLLEGVLARMRAPDPERRARLLCAGLDGLLLEHLGRGRERAELRTLVVELIELVASAR